MVTRPRRNIPISPEIERSEPGNPPPSLSKMVEFKESLSTNLGLFCNVLNIAITLFRPRLESSNQVDMNWVTGIEQASTMISILAIGLRLYKFAITLRKATQYLDQTITRRKEKNFSLDKYELLSRLLVHFTFLENRALAIKIMPLLTNDLLEKDFNGKTIQQVAGTVDKELEYEKHALITCLFVVLGVPATILLLSLSVCFFFSETVPSQNIFLFTGCVAFACSTFIESIMEIALKTPIESAKNTYNIEERLEYIIDKDIIYHLDSQENKDHLNNALSRLTSEDKNALLQDKDFDQNSTAIIISSPFPRSSCRLTHSLLFTYPKIIVEQDIKDLKEKIETNLKSIDNKRTSLLKKEKILTNGKPLSTSLDNLKKTCDNCWASPSSLARPNELETALDDAKNALNSKGRKEIKNEIDAITTAVNKLKLAMTRLTDLTTLEDAPMSEVNNLFRRGNHV